MSYLNWFAGMKVVCLGNPEWPRWYVLPEVGEVYTRTTDISIFTAMLIGTKHMEPA